MLGFDSKNTDALKKALQQDYVDADLVRLTARRREVRMGRFAIAFACRDQKRGVLIRIQRLAGQETGQSRYYTLININVQRQFSGGYALALYENCLRFKAWSRPAGFPSKRGDVC